jgi:hypothetical protein
MYKFYQEQPENNWVYHPMRDENREDNEKKDSNNSFVEPETDYFSFGNQESPMGQGQNKRQNFAAHMLPASNRIGTIPTQPQKSNALPGSIATGNEKLKDWKNKLKGALDVIKDVADIASGAYTPEYFFPNRFMPQSVSGFMNYMSMRDIDKWEEENKKRNSAKRERVERMKGNPFTSPIARGYEKTMDAKIARELAFPFRSPAHSAAAVDIGFGTNKKYNNLSSASDRFANEIDNYFYRGDKKNGEKRYLSTLRNSMRHTIWQATLASQHNPQVAYSAGMAHETRPYADTDKRVFDNESDADMVVDLLNNAIGRRIGASNRHLSRKQIALLALKELWENGLYQYEHFNDGLWRVMKVRISNDVYNEMYNTFMNLDNEGL